MTSNTKTERQLLTEFLILYRDSPCLWYMQHPLYTNRESREQAYEVLLEKYRTIEEDATMDSMKKKIDNMRCAYKRERRKVVTSLASGIHHKPMLWYYKYMRFIDNVADECINFDSITSMHLEDDAYEIEEEECEPQLKRMKKEDSPIFIPAFHEDEEGLVTQSQSDCLADDYGHEQSSPTDAHEAESFGTTVGLQLKELEPTQRFIAEKLISEVIFYGRLDKLNMQSNVSLNQDVQ